LNFAVFHGGRNPFMLPDFPKAKQKVLNRVMNRFRSRTKSQTGPFNEAPAKKIFEGHRWRIERPDGTFEDNELEEQAVDMKITPEEIEKISPEQILEKFDDAADEMARQLSGKFINDLKRITQETGNVVNGKSQPFSMEKFFEILEKIEIEFRPDGEPELPTIVAGPRQVQRIRKVFAQAEKDRRYKDRYHEIIEKKRQIWRARENTRKLVG
jgi:hypothetical protein